MDESSDELSFEHAEVKAISDRIQRVEMARGLAAAGKYEKALELLHKVRDAYEDESMRLKVDWLIAEVERKAAAQPPG